MLNKPVTVAISEKAIGEDVLKGIDEIVLQPMNRQPKTASQRLRAVLYKVWETNKTIYDTHEAHYEATMEQLINHFKGQIKE